ncbi:hypothetical protein SAMD00019534_039930 [Acytostelium subglobosum LB1]|uniref:hypothetical protein n=1 Tax=Acytostelium subglobosum LB1 TaxID=1410327 RepID=UPI0006452369|nr:hypothetical protein SAMD00019534_039930 [Acytostelium subglobosum LB1]GAM20818.1 hypothetical protein SAMD00019534_039930 [Acytostelium subglobosum LB1]|eukprot:XP_012755952.1 hypothetical protein SAMD00019534_039930 [Acytostelium subglobosum LB1]
MFVWMKTVLRVVSKSTFRLWVVLNGCAQHSDLTLVASIVGGAFRPMQNQVWEASVQSDGTAYMDIQVRRRPRVRDTNFQMVVEVKCRRTGRSITKWPHPINVSFTSAARYLPPPFLYSLRVQPRLDGSQAAIAGHYRVKVHADYLMFGLMRSKKGTGTPNALTFFVLQWTGVAGQSRALITDVVELHQLDDINHAEESVCMNLAQQWVRSPLDGPPCLLVAAYTYRDTNPQTGPTPSNKNSIHHPGPIRNLIGRDWGTLLVEYQLANPKPEMHNFTYLPIILID